MADFIIVVILAAAVYYVSLRIWPYTYCRRCQGDGRNAGSTREAFGFCRACNHTGRKLRLGVRLFTRG